MNPSHAKIAAILIALGCNQAMGGWDRYVRTPPAESELVGVWRPDQASLDRLGDAGGEHTGPDDHLLDLRPDHSCAFRSYVSYGFPGAPFITKRACEWRLSTATAYVHHERRDVPAVDVSLREANATTVAHFYIVREGGLIVLWQFIGDPDYSVYMDFSRR